MVVKEAFYENKENSSKKFVVPIKCNEYLIERHIRIFDLSRDRPIFRHKKLDSSGCTVHPEKEKGTQRRGRGSGVPDVDESQEDRE